MQHAQRTEHIRQFIRVSLGELGAASNAEIHETILIRAGIYCGRRFDCDGLQAVWFIEEEQVKFYGRDGSIAQVLTENHSSWVAQQQAA